MKIEHILERGSGDLNEDAIVLEKNLFGVFDGATSLDHGIFENGKTGGLIASSTASAVFAKNHHPLVKLAKGANREIYNKMITHGVNLSKKEKLWSTSASVIRIKENTIEWIQTGDSAIILIYRDNSYKVLVEQDNHDYETLTMWKKEAEKGTLDIGSALMDQIIKVRSGMNISYGVLNGEKAAHGFFNHGNEPLAGVREILLFTDGLSIPGETTEKNRDHSTMIKLYLSLGLEGLKKRIREMEAKDPHCTLYPRFKCHDDIAAIAIKDL